MTTKVADTEVFPTCYTLGELKEAIGFVVAELAREYALLSRARECFVPLTSQDRVLLGTERKDLTTADLASWRIMLWEAVQDRLWSWYGQAVESGFQGRKALGRSN